MVDPTIRELQKLQGNGKEIGLGFDAQERYTPADLKDILRRLSNEVYGASSLLEEHEQYHGEGPGCLRGNGHHMRQRAAQAVQNLFVERLHPEYRKWFVDDGDGGYRLKVEVV